MFYCFIAKPGEKNESRTITKNYYKQKLTKFLRERLGPSMRSRSSAMAPRTLFEGAQDFMLRKLRDQEELQDETGPVKRLKFAFLSLKNRQTKSHIHQQTSFILGQFLNLHTVKGAMSRYLLSL